MSTHTSSSDDSSSDHLELDPEYIPPYNVRTNSLEISSRETRSKTQNLRRRSNSLNSIISLINLEDNTPILKPEVIMPPVALSFDTAINLVPKFNGECAQEVYPFLSTCDFVIKSVSEDCRPILLQAILTKLAGKAYAATQHREVKSWETLRGLLEVTFCAKRTPGYLQLELTTTKHKAGETVQEYSSRVEALLHELCNVSTAKRSPTDAKAVHEYIKETTLTTYVEGLPFSIRGVIKSKNHTSLEEAIKDSLEEDRIYQSNKGTLYYITNPITTVATNIVKTVKKLIITQVNANIPIAQWIQVNKASKTRIKL